MKSELNPHFLPITKISSKLRHDMSFPIAFRKIAFSDATLYLHDNIVGQCRQKLLQVRFRQKGNTRLKLREEHVLNIYIYLLRLSNTSPLLLKM